MLPIYNKSESIMAILLAKADIVPLPVRHMNVTAMIVDVVFSLPSASANGLWL